MATGRGLRRALTVIAVGSAMAALSCLGPTEVTLVLTTDVPCDAEQGTSIAVGSPDDVSTSAPVTITNDCALAGGAGSVDDAGALAVPASIGTMVVVPSGSRSASFVVQIVTAVAPVVQPSDCAAPDYMGCIVARRQISFIPHTPLTVPIEMTLDCLNVPCPTGQTCSHGKCVTAVTTCTPPECTLDVATSDASSSADDTAPGAGDETTVGNAIDATLMDSSPEMGQPDVSTVDAPSADGPADVSTDDVSIADASSDSTADVSVKDAAVDVSSGGGSDASEASAPPSDGAIPGDGSPLGNCVDAGTSGGGVACDGAPGGRCAAGQVCCVAFNTSGGQVTQTCEALGSCDYNAIGNPTYSALACRDIGDCGPGTVCCATSSSTGSGSIAQCLSSCPVTTYKQTLACQNSCECPMAEPHCDAVICFGYSIGVCSASPSDTNCPF